MSTPARIEVTMSDSEKDIFSLKLYGKRFGVNAVALTREQVETLGVLCDNALKIWPEE